MICRGSNLLSHKSETTRVDLILKFLCIIASPLGMYVHQMSAFIPRTQKREFDAVEMELQIGVSYRVHDGT